MARPAPRPRVDGLLRAALDHHRSGRIAEAERGYRAALDAAPDQPDALYLLGMLRSEARSLDEAEALLARAVRADPGRAGAHDGLGTTLLRRGCVAEAIESHARAVALAPRDARLRAGLAYARQRGGDLAAAVRDYGEALALDPALRPAWQNVGHALGELGLLDEAAVALARALALGPGSAEAHVNLGNVYREAGRIDEAIRCYRAALALDPSLDGARSNLLLALHYLDGVPAAALLDEHRAWDRAHGAGALPIAPGGAFPRREPARPLRVGYVSADLREHSVASFLEPVLAAHDTSRVEPWLYSQTARHDAVTARLAAHAHGRFVDLRTLDDEQAARRVRADGIDVLVDLSGHTAEHRLGIFARRAAPVQLSWLGYPDTTGLAAMDYRLVDERTDPTVGGDARAVEALVRLPGCFLCYGAPPDLPEPAPPPSQGGGPPVFGSFNCLAKISDSTVRAWAAVLATAPGSRLLVKARGLADPGTAGRLRARLAGAGVGPDRVELLGHVPSRAAHLALYARVDVALDTFPYNGTTTTCEALWMGVPVVTRAGDRHVARVGASLLGALGLDELIASGGDPARADAEYAAIAIGLAADRERLAALRSSLRARMAASVLCDAPRFTRALEETMEDLRRAADRG